MDKKTEGAKKYFISTYGCQMNVRDSETLAGILESKGYCPTPQEEKADLIILNTCCVREKAENKVYGKLGHLKALKEKRRELIIAVCGCMPQQPGVGEEIRQKAPFVDLIFGTQNLSRLGEFLERMEAGERPFLETGEEDGVLEGLPVKRQGKVKAYVNISFGCNNFCTYCVVPYVRGRERSREPEAILRETRDLAAEGFKEVTLLGQNVNTYGKDLPNKIDFGDLLSLVEEVEGIVRIRYTTSHPRDFNQKIIEKVATSPKICEHFHLPVQAGGNQVLARMNRGYTKEGYLELVKEIRKLIPEAAITTDIMVGFPGETEAEFEETLDLVRQACFDQAYTFIYSPRRGTPAATMPGQVTREVKKRRFQELVRLQDRISREINQKLCGREVEVLVEGKSKTNPSNLSGRTRTNKIVVFPGEEKLTGELVKVKIKEAETWTLKGDLV